MPRWLIRAARPSPAAMPANGPIHDRFGGVAGAAAGAVLVAPGVAAGLAGTG
jgi:hypothetical protein